MHGWIGMIILCQSQTNGRQCLIANLVLGTVVEEYRGENAPLETSFYINNNFIFSHFHILYVLLSQKNNKDGNKITSSCIEFLPVLTVQAQRM